MRRAPPISGRLSIGLVRFDARLLAGVSTRITFTTVHAHAQVLAEIRRQRGELQNCFQTVRVEAPIVRCLHLTAADERSEGLSLAGAGSAILRPSLCHHVVNAGGPQTSSLRPRSARLRGDSHGGPNIGEAYGVRLDDDEN